MSSIGWVDFSSEDRQRVQDVLALLKEKGTLDELGIGQVRDAYSDCLFPGFSTIQTSARYFLAIPKIFRDWAALKDAQRAKAPLEAYLRRAENALAKQLREGHLAAGRALEGIIGHTLVEKGGAARLPSSTYWNGLRVFGLVKTDLSLSEFCRSWGQDIQVSHVVDAEDGADDAQEYVDMTVCLPPGGKAVWPADLSLSLTKPEADYLADKFQHARHQEHSVAAQLLAAGLLKKSIRGELERFDAFSTWAQSQATISETCRDSLRRAKRFSLAMEGAHIVYNRLLANTTGNAQLRDTCATRMADWNARVRLEKVFHEDATAEWLSVFSTSKSTVKPETSDFLNAWNSALCNRATDAKLDALVKTQAKANKPGRSLVIKPPKKHQKWYGMDTLDYRWQTARGMLSEVFEGQKC